MKNRRKHYSVALSVDASNGKGQCFFNCFCFSFYLISECQTVLKFCAEHSGINAVFSSKFQKILKLKRINQISWVFILEWVSEEYYIIPYTATERRLFCLRKRMPNIKRIRWPIPHHTPSTGITRHEGRHSSVTTTSDQGPLLPT